VVGFDPEGNGNGGLKLGVTNLSVRLPGDARPVLDGLDLELEEGRAIGVSGRSGVGKSTLLHAISGLVPWLRPAEVHGDVRLDGDSVMELDPGQRAHIISTCLDRPDSQLFLPTVRQELVAACRLHRHGEPVEALASELGISNLMERRITELSSGQRQRVALCCALAGTSGPVLLDEPTAHLDTDGVSDLCDVVSDRTNRGNSFLVAEQAGWRLGEEVDSWVRMTDGRLEISDRPGVPRFPTPDAAATTTALACRNLSISRGGRKLLDGASFDLRVGEIVLLTGANGAGKSTLAQVVAGLRRPDRGDVVTGRRVALMLPSAELQLFGSSVLEEVSAAGVERAEGAKVLRRHRLEHLAARAPWTLSRGERQRLVHARLDLMRPGLMVVDEPAQGLDPEDLAAFVDLVHRRAQKGRAYLIISHRLELETAAHRRIEIRDEKVVEVSR
jgi:energy-coupling factor transport system ATP-binding protein